MQLSQFSALVIQLIRFLPDASTRPKSKSSGAQNEGANTTATKPNTQKSQQFSFGGFRLNMTADDFAKVSPFSDRKRQ